MTRGGLPLGSGVRAETEGATNGVSDPAPAAPAAPAVRTKAEQENHLEGGWLESLQLLFGFTNVFTQMFRTNLVDYWDTIFRGHYAAEHI